MFSACVRSGRDRRFSRRLRAGVGRRALRVEPLEARVVLATVIPFTPIGTALASFTQFGNGGGFVGEASSSRDGSLIVFRSNEDITGQNPDENSEIFTANPATGAITQITNTTQGTNEKPAVDGDGTKIFFSSSADLTGNNADGTREIFVFDVAAGTFTQITNQAKGQSTSPSVSDDGNVIAFRSSSDLTGSNADGNPEAFVFDAATGTFTQITNTVREPGRGFPDFVAAPRVNSQGTAVVFSARADLTGDNPDTAVSRNEEVFLYQVQTGMLTQITKTESVGGLLGGGSSAINRNPTISGDGTLIVLESNSDLTTDPAGNPVPDSAMYLFDTTTGSFARVPPLGFGVSNTTTFSISDNGKIAFESDQNVTGNNTDRNFEIFVFDTNTNTTTQITNTTGPGNFVQSISPDGKKVNFLSDGDPTGENSDGNFELFQVDTTTGEVKQISNTSPAGTGGASLSPSSDASGDWVTFDSSHNLTGGNQNLSSEIFLGNVFDGTLMQITDTPDPFASSGPLFSPDGSGIFFNSRADFTGGNPTNAPQIFRYDVATAAISQVVPASAGPSLSPSVNWDGTLAAYASSGNPTGENADGNGELFLTDVPGGAIWQVTDTVGTTAYNGHRLSAGSTVDGGSQMVFVSNGDLIPGGNPDRNQEVFSAEITGGQVALHQLTTTTTGNAFWASISADGKNIAVASTADLIGANADGNQEIYLITCVGSGPPCTTTQITNTTGAGNDVPEINADGTVITFTSDADFTGDNPEGNPEIFQFFLDIGQFSQVTRTADGVSVFPFPNAAATRITFVSNADHVRSQNLPGGILTFSVEVTSFVVDAANAADGSGTAIISPGNVPAGSTGNEMTLAYTAEGTMDGGAVQVTIPSGWSAPQNVVGTAGFTTVASTGSVGAPHFSGQTIHVPIINLAANETITVVYGSGGGASGATAQGTIGTVTFDVASQGSAEGSLVPIGQSPIVTVTSVNDGNAALLDDPLNPGQRMLVVTGTRGDDTIQISPAENVAVLLNGRELGVFDPTSRIVMFGLEGDDEIHVAGSIMLPVWLYGGPGDDRLKGGRGDDLLFGEEGSDLLLGGKGRDLLIGGLGADRMVGNAGDDILIGSTTAFDAHEAALAAIMAEWTSTRGFEVRVANLNGTGSGSDFENRHNGDFFLKTDGGDATVVDDNARDVMTGASGRDWFFLDQNEDNATDLRRNEFADVLDLDLAEALGDEISGKLKPPRQMVQSLTLGERSRPTRPSL